MTTTIDSPTGLATRFNVTIDNNSTGDTKLIFTSYRRSRRARLWTVRPCFRSPIMVTLRPSILPCSAMMV